MARAEWWESSVSLATIAQCRSGASVMSPSTICVHHISLHMFTFVLYKKYYVNHINLLNSIKKHAHTHTDVRIHLYIPTGMLSKRILLNDAFS